jgi:Mce-associated membrane protein
MRGGTDIAADRDEVEALEQIETETGQSLGADEEERADQSTDTASGDAAESQGSDAAEPGKIRRAIGKITRGVRWSRITVYGLLPGLVLLLALGAGFLKWQAAQTGDSAAGVDAVASAKNSIVALLTYKPDSVEKDLGEAARDRLTGPFKDSYSQLVHDVVVPGAKQHGISAVATVPAAASVSATPNHAVALLFVNQTVVVGTEPPSDSGSSVKVTLDKIGNRWLISGFEPV